jgi:pimeloyl-ACP methyl ester carboxylesterase
VTTTFFRGLCVLGLVLIGLMPAAHAGQRHAEAVVTLAGRPPVRLYVTEAGTGPPLLLLHGLGGSGYTFRHLVPLLARTHRVITLDLKGFGRSEKPLDGAYGPMDHAELVVAFLRQQRLSGVTLIGHSFGGAVALLATLQLNVVEPWRIKRLVLMNTPAFAQDLPHLQRLMTMPVLPYVALTLSSPLMHTRRALQSLRRTAPRATDDDAKRYAEPLYETGGRHALIATSRGIADTDPRQFVPYYRAIRQPALLIWCRHDPTVPLASGERLLRSLSQARLAVLEHCDHMPPEEQPAETARLIHRFLKP